MNASACSRASSLGARSGCMRLAASRNSRLSEAGGTGLGRRGERARRRVVRGGALVRLARAPAAVAGALEDPRLDVVELREHGDDLARVVGLEDRELGLEHRVLGLDLGEPVAHAGQVGLADRDELRRRQRSSCGTRRIMTVGARVGGLGARALDRAQARGPPAAVGEDQPPADVEGLLHRPARRAVLRDQLVRDRRDGALARDRRCRAGGSRASSRSRRANARSGRRRP